jgi:hypothetical protein
MVADIEGDDMKSNAISECGKNNVVSERTIKAPVVLLIISIRKDRLAIATWIAKRSSRIAIGLPASGYVQTALPSDRRTAITDFSPWTYATGREGSRIPWGKESSDELEPHAFTPITKDSKPNL